jgi:hypothetical protein
MSLFTTALRAVRSDFAEALAAVYRTAFAGLKGYFGFFAALGADRWVHLARLAAGAVTLGFPGLPAVRAPLGLIGVALGLEELLFRGAERERSSAISTRKGLVLKSQRMTSFLQLVG